MKKKLDTRFPAARIKKIMQTDEDVGKIAMAVPLLVSKALELFLQDLCDQTYNITIQRGAKTVNSLHLKQCVQRFSVFDFLREIVNKVPDLGGSDACNEDQSVAKRRKLAEEEKHQSDEELKKSRVHEASHSSSSGRGRWRGRGRGRGRPSRSIDVKFEDDPDTPLQNYDELKRKQHNPVKSEESELVGKNIRAPLLNFDLNVNLNDSEDSASASTAPDGSSMTATASVTGSVSAPEVKLEEYPIPGWSLADAEKIAIDPSQLVHFNTRMDEDDDDDYDKED